MAECVTEATYIHRTQEHAGKVLRLLNKLRGQEVFCDITLKVGSKTFLVHRNVLAAASPYFEAMFTTGLLEKEKEEVAIHGIDEMTFEALLDFIYTGEIEVRGGSCQDLLAGADMLGLSDVVEACCHFMRLQLHPSNCIGIYLFADAHGCVELRETSEAYIDSNIIAVSNEDEFLNIPKHLLIKILYSENIFIENEFQVYQMALKWLEHDVKARRLYVFEVMAPIRFPLISLKQLEKNIEACKDLSLRIALQKLVHDFRRDGKVPLEVKFARLNPSLLQPRKCARKTIYVIGGFKRDVGGRWSDSQTLASVECFNTFNQTWETVASPRYARSGHGVGVFNGLIYIVGGENESLIYDNAECFDPGTNKWTMVASMMLPRCGFGLCVIEDALYALGGWVGSEIGKTVEKFDPALGHWTTVDELRTLRYATGVVAHNGLIYVLGGVTELGSELTCVESFNPITHEWTPLNSMQTARAYMGVAAIDNCLYAVGGWNDDGTLQTVEKYSIEENSWTYVSPLSCPRAGASVAAVNGLIYVIGGRTSGNEYTAPSTLDSVECYDPQTNSWFAVSSMPTGRCEAAIAIL